MKLLRFLRREGAEVDLRFLFLNLISGVANGLLLVVIVTTADEGSGGEAPGISSFLTFVILLAVYALAEKRLLDHSVRTLEAVIRGVRVRLTDKLRRAGLRRFEKIGHPRVYSVLAQDSLLLGTSAYEVMKSFSSAIVLVFGFLFIATLSFTAFLGVLVVLVLGVVMYMRQQVAIQRELHRGAALESEFFESLNHLLLGFKQLRMHEAKNDDLYESSLQRLALENEALKTRVGYRINSSSIFPMVHFYLLIGFVVYALPHFDVPIGATGQIVTMILFFLGPLGDVLNAQPALTKADFAIDHIEELEHEIDEAEGEPLEVGHQLPPFEELTARDLRFTYEDSTGNPGFTAGPFDFEITRGKIVFLVGGNGTGKSTLLHLLSGLYAPTGGEIRVNGERVSPGQPTALHAYYSCILQDFHLFDRLYGIDEVDLERTQQLLEDFDLTGITSVLPDGRLERVNLSTGQKKRLALLVSELDDREILIFDEWAADQDPEHRRYFYKEYLPSLKARNKTVIAATHDDHYFDVADEVIKLSEGTIVYRGSPTEVDLGF